MKTPLVMPRRVRLAKEESIANPGGLYFSSAKENIQFIHTGCTLLDLVLGGGWALGRIVNVVGDRSTGKTLVAMEAIANFFRQYQNGDCWYNEAESAFDSDYARALGIPFDRVNYKQDCTTVEELYEHIDAVVFNKKRHASRPGFYIIDSLDALSDKAEMSRGIDEGSFGAAKAKKLSEFFRRTTQRLKTTNTCLMVISQVRDAIGVMFGEKHSRSGGKALDFYVSQALWLANIEALKQEISKIKRQVGVRIRARCKKNKVALPFRECEFNIKFGYGIDDTSASLEFLEKLGVSANGVSPDALRELVVKHWYSIEKGFLPTERKYNN